SLATIRRRGNRSILVTLIAIILRIRSSVLFLLSVLRCILTLNLRTTTRSLRVLDNSLRLAHDLPTSTRVRHWDLIRSRHFTITLINKLHGHVSIVQL